MFDGALSSSTLKEASSWGKVDTAYEQMVFSEATLAVPLIAGDVLLGVLDVQSDREGGFGPDDVQVQQSLVLRRTSAVRWTAAVEIRGTGVSFGQESPDAPGIGQSQQATGSSSAGSASGQIRGGSHSGVGSIAAVSRTQGLLASSRLATETPALPILP